MNGLFGRLAFRAPAGRSPANGGAGEIGAAARAASAGFPTVGKEPVFGISPVVVDDAHGGAADPTHSLPEALGLRGFERAGGCGRMEAGAPEDFVGHPVADAREVFLHEEHGFERGAAAAFEEAGEARERKFLGKNAWGERRPPGGWFGALVEAHAAEVAFVLEDEGMGGLVEDEMIVLARGVVRKEFTAEFAAHAEMNAQPEIVGELEEHLFAAGLGGEEFFAGELGAKSGGVGVTEDADLGSGEANGKDGLAKTRVPLAAAVFDFGEFRHKREGERCREEK